MSMYIVQKIKVGGSGKNSMGVMVTDSFKKKGEAMETWENYVNKAVGSNVGTDMIAQWDDDHELEWAVHKGEAVIYIRIEQIAY